MLILRMCRPVEISQVNIFPSDFFTCNPSIDVPSKKNEASQLAGCGDCNGVNGHAVNGTDSHPVNGMEALNVNGTHTPVVNGAT